jgi:DNA-binding GntR family transcriptional regulator
MSLSGTEWRILDLLLAAGQPLPVAQVVATIGSTAAVADALDTLHAAGLVERTGALVSVTRASASGDLRR